MLIWGYKKLKISWCIFGRKLVLKQEMKKVPPFPFGLKASPPSTLVYNRELLHNFMKLFCFEGGYSPTQKSVSRFVKKNLVESLFSWNGKVHMVLLFVLLHCFDCWEPPGLKSKLLKLRSYKTIWMSPSVPHSTAHLPDSKAQN